jgi:hypothetical protein
MTGDLHLIRKALIILLRLLVTSSQDRIVAVPMECSMFAIEAADELRLAGRCFLLV